MTRGLLSLAGAALLSRTGLSQRSSAGVAAAMRLVAVLQAARTSLASAANVSARSVRSQVNSRSVRPKCP